MRLLVLGRVRYKVVSGFGPFKKEEWRDRNFEVKISPGEELRPVDDVVLKCVTVGQKLELEGTLKGQICYFGGFGEPNVGLRCNFIMTSVRNIEFRGSIEVIA